MPACEACGGAGSRMARTGRGIGQVACAPCQGTGKQNSQYQIPYPPEVIQALQGARGALQQASEITQQTQQLRSPPAG